MDILVYCKMHISLPNAAFANYTNEIIESEEIISRTQNNMAISKAGKTLK